MCEERGEGGHGRELRRGGACVEREEREDTVES